MEILLSTVWEMTGTIIPEDHSYYVVACLYGAGQGVARHDADYNTRNRKIVALTAYGEAKFHLEMEKGKIVTLTLAGEIIVFDGDIPHWADGVRHRESQTYISFRAKR